MAATVSPALPGPRVTAGPVPEPESESTPWPDNDEDYVELPGDAESFESASPAALPTASQQSDPPDDETPPAVKELAGRIPEDVRRTLSELFRAEFDSVRKIRPEDLL